MRHFGFGFDIGRPTRVLTTPAPPPPPLAELDFVNGFFLINNTDVVNLSDILDMSNFIRDDNGLGIFDGVFNQTGAFLGELLAVIQANPDLTLFFEFEATGAHDFDFNQDVGANTLASRISIGDDNSLSFSVADTAGTSPQSVGPVAGSAPPQFARAAISIIGGDYAISISQTSGTVGHFGSPLPLASGNPYFRFSNGALRLRAFKVLQPVAFADLDSLTVAPAI